MLRVLREATELSFEAGDHRVNPACTQKRLKRLRQQADCLRVTRPDLEVVLDRVRDGHESTLVVAVHLHDGSVDPADLAQCRFVDIRQIVAHAPEPT
jgi:hypothetical protein